MKKIILLILMTINSYAQTFYVNVAGNVMGSPANQLLKLDVSNSTEVNEFICLPYGKTYMDMAIDQNGDIYYVDYETMLHQQTKDGKCLALGKFPTIGSANINALITDNNNYLYACGQEFGNRISAFYKYDLKTGIFSRVGDLPPNFNPSGDLFFYDKKLFLTCMEGILEIDMINPTQSCLYMPFTRPAYGAFSISNGSESKAYVILIDYYSSLLHELDMKNRTLGTLIRAYPYNIYGAASQYSLTSSNARCNIIQSFNIPNIFTPNGDGFNDTFYITDVEKGNWELKVYDRRGLLVYESETYKNDWKGDKLPSALYYYRLVNKDGEGSYNGWVQILK